MHLTRRHFVAGIGAMGISENRALAATAVVEPEIPLSIAAGSPWFANAVALTRANQMFLGLPRFPGHEVTPSVVRVARDGSVAPFPGGSWNDWKPGEDGRNAFVYVNSVHIFADDTVWCVDQGALRSDNAQPGAQKLIRLHPQTGKILTIIRFADDMVPPGSKLNDLRIYGKLIYMTDSGIGGLLVHDTATGKTLRRLSGNKLVLGIPWGTPGGPKHAGVKPKHGIPASDIIEVSPDGAWLYWGSPTGPLRRLSTQLLRDPAVTDDELAAKTELVAVTPVMGGTAMDTLGNIFISDILGRRILLRAPSGQQVTIASSQQMVSPDAMFISADRHLYIPSTQAQFTAEHSGGVDHTHPPFLTFSIPLPRVFAGISLGDALTGVPIPG